MRRSLMSVLYALCALCTAACPFESQVPLGEPVSGTLDARLLGLWTWIEPGGGSVGQFRVQRFNDNEYLADYEEFGPKVRQAKRETYRVFGVRLGDEVFLNVEQLRREDDHPRFLFARYSFTDCGELSLRFVGEQAVPEELATDRGALHTYLAAHPRDATLDDPEGPMVFHRAGA